MKYLLSCLILISCCAAALAQEVVLSDGDSLAAEVQKFENNRVSLKTQDGKILRYKPSRLQFAIDKDGMKTRFAAQLLQTPMNAQQRAGLDQLQAGQEVDERLLFAMAEDCSQDLFEALRDLAKAEADASRARALRILAMVASPETIRLAVDAAVHDNSAKVRLAAAQHLSSSTAIAAIEKAGVLHELEEGLTEKDASARFSMAYAAVELGSESARPILAKFVKDRDHHIREAAAVTLAEQGDAAGEKVLIQMLKRKESPMIAANRDADAAFLAKLRAADERERIHVCSLVGQLHLKSARSTLKSLSKSDSPRLADAATSALKLLDLDSQN